MNIINILKGIENLAIELLLWIIYIPKTLFKIIKDPYWVPDYVSDELKNDDKFTNYMSPVLLYLGNSVILFVISDMIGSKKEMDFLKEVQGIEGLIFLVLPLLLALIIELFRKGPFNRGSILRGLFIQCYYFSPLMLALFAFNISDAFYWTTMDSPFASLIPLFLFLLTCLWFIIVEIRFISKDLGFNKFKGSGVFFIWSLLLLISFIYYSVITNTDVDEQQNGEIESYLLNLNESGEHSISISKMIDASPYFMDSNDAYSIKIALKDDKGNDKLSSDRNNWYLAHNYMIYGQEYSGNNDEIHVFKGEKGDMVRIDIEHDEDGFIWGDELGINIVENGDIELAKDEMSISTPLNFDGNPQKRFAEFELPQTGLYRFLNYYFAQNPETYKSDYHIKLSKIEQFFAQTSTKAPEIKYFEKYSGKFDNEGIWNFMGKKGDKIEVKVAPLDSIDISFNVYKEGESVVPIHNDNIVWPLRWLYIILFGYAVLTGYRAFFRKKKKEEIPLKDSNDL